MAFRRGLLTPDYKYGDQSIVREELILHMLEQEHMAEWIWRSRLLNDVLIAPNANRKYLSRYITDTAHRIAWLREFAAYSTTAFQTYEDKLATGASQMIKVWKKWESDGTLTKIADRLKRQYEAYINRTT